MISATDILKEIKSLVNTKAKKFEEAEIKNLCNELKNTSDGINFTLSAKTTVVHYLAKYNNENLLNHLKDLDANFWLKNYRGFTPLRLALQYDKDKSKEFYKKLVKERILDYFENGVRDCIYYDEYDLVSYWLDYIVKDSQYKYKLINGNTGIDLLHYACEMASVNVVRLLLEHVDPRAIGKSYKNALQITCDFSSNFGENIEARDLVINMLFNKERKLVSSNKNDLFDTNSLIGHSGSNTCSALEIALDMGEYDLLENLFENVLLNSYLLNDDINPKMSLSSDFREKFFEINTFKKFLEEKYEEFEQSNHNTVSTISYKFDLLKKIAHNDNLQELLSTIEGDMCIEYFDHSGQCNGISIGIEDLSL